MLYNFDKVIDRSGSDCVKYDDLTRVFGCTDVLPMWVADMDFQSPLVVLEAARQCCERGVFGYTFRSADSKQAFMDWVAARHQWHIKPEWMSTSPGIVTALSISVRAFTQKGDKVLIMTPVYPPFYSVVKDNGRELVCSSLVAGERRFEINWEDFEAKLKQGVRLLILCNSHNPVGRVWERAELEKIGNLCCKYGVIILSDEIHSDLALFGHKHTVMASVSEEIGARTLTAMAPSKTFNIAGMMNSVIVSSSPELLEKYNKELLALHLDSGNIFGHVTMVAAYRYGGEWLDQLITYIERNVDYADRFIREELPEVRMMKPEGSFLLWLDFRGTGLTHEEVGHRLVHKAKIGLNDGQEFGVEGSGFRRMNVGCPLSVLDRALRQIKSAF